MGTYGFSDNFNRDAMAQINECGYPVAEVPNLLAVTTAARLLSALTRIRLTRNTRKCCGLASSGN